MTTRPSLQTVCHFLREVDIFHALAADELNWVAAMCEQHTFQKGELLAQEGQQGDSLYLVLAGEVHFSTTGAQEVVVGTARERESLPLTVFLEPPTSPTSARAATDVEVMAIPRSKLLKLCWLQPFIGMHLYEAAATLFAERYYKALGHLTEAAHPARQMIHAEVGTALDMHGSLPHTNGEMGWPLPPRFTDEA